MMNKRKPTRQTGFTLIELMMVMTIIGILAAIAIPTYQNYTLKAKVAEALVLTGPAKLAIAEYHVVNGRIPHTDCTHTTATASANCNAGYGIQTVVSDVVESIYMNNGGIITVNLQDSLSDDIVDNDQINLTPVVNTSGVITWSCSSATINGLDTKFLPANCR